MAQRSERRGPGGPRHSRPGGRRYSIPFGEMLNEENRLAWTVQSTIRQAEERALSLALDLTSACPGRFIDSRSRLLFTLCALGGKFNAME